MTPRVCAALVCLASALLPGCAVKKLAVNMVGNALASGGSTFESDDDPELVEGALPFGLKFMESLLAESPRHRGLLTATASGFTEYAYAFVGERADEAALENVDLSNALRLRARRLYLRAHGYGMRGLETRYKGFAQALERDPGAALARTRKRDVPLLYWTAAALGLAISSSKDNPEMIAQLPTVDAMVQRVRQLDPEWGAGAVPQFLITLESTRSGVPLAEQQKRMRTYFDEAVHLSKGESAGPYLSFAENACVPAQNRAEFKSMLEKALAVDVERTPSGRLSNLVSQRRARWLLGRIDELFLDDTPSQPAAPASEVQTQ